MLSHLALLDDVFKNKHKAIKTCSIFCYPTWHCGLGSSKTPLLPSSHCSENLQGSLFSTKIRPTLGLAFKELHHLNLTYISKVPYDISMQPDCHCNLQNTGSIYNSTFPTLNSFSSGLQYTHMQMHVHICAHQNTAFLLNFSKSHPSVRFLTGAQTFEAW